MTAIYCVVLPRLGMKLLREKSFASPNLTAYAMPRNPNSSSTATLHMAAMLETVTDSSTPRMPTHTISQHMSVAMAASTRLEAPGANA